jgi:hypothetical protein
MAEDCLKHFTMLEKSVSVRGFQGYLRGDWELVILDMTLSPRKS